jgi:DNA-binding response OmpR family regulator
LHASAPLPRVLVVDDEASDARAVAAGLRSEGFDVETAHGADSALRLLGHQRFHLAVVDLMLRGTNGIQLARLIRERHPETRVAITSSYHLGEGQLLRADCGAVGFVPKPLDGSALARFVRGKLAGSGCPGEGLGGSLRPGAVAGAATSR